MCGILAILLNESDKRKKLKKKIKALVHRGPDEIGYFENEDIFIGHTRLSIKSPEWFQSFCEKPHQKAQRFPLREEHHRRVRVKRNSFLPFAIPCRVGKLDSFPTQFLAIKFYSQSDNSDLCLEISPVSE